MSANAQYDRDGNLTVTVAVPPEPEWASRIDSAFHRMEQFCTPTNRWHFVSLSVPSYSYGYICVMEKKDVTQSMSGSAGLAAAVAGFGAHQTAAIDDAVERAKAWDEADQSTVQPT
jgi:hypothetical protein